MCILYKSDPELYIADRLSCHNHTENRDQEIKGININIHTISTPVVVPIYTSIEDIRAAMNEDVELQMPKTYIVRGNLILRMK